MAAPRFAAAASIPSVPVMPAPLQVDATPTAGQTGAIAPEVMASIVTLSTLETRL